MMDKVPDRGRRAWDLVRREWGRAVADALWRGQPVQVLARNGHLYEVRLDLGDRSTDRMTYRWCYPRVRDLTTGDKLCVEMTGASEYPAGDRLFVILEHLRTDPENLDRTANHTPDARAIFRRAFRGMWNHAMPRVR